MALKVLHKKDKTFVKKSNENNKVTKTVNKIHLVIGVLCDMGDSYLSLNLQVK